jgi:hypothetical protein
MKKLGRACLHVILPAWGGVSRNSLTLQKSTSIPFSTAFKKRESPGNLKRFIDAVASLSRAFDVHERPDFLANHFTLQR